MEDATRNDGVDGGCAGDDNGFGGTFDADEVVVYGNSSSGSGTPMFNQQTGSWQHSHCQGCSAGNRITDGHDPYVPLGRYIATLHQPGCSGQLNPDNPRSRRNYS